MYCVCQTGRFQWLCGGFVCVVKSLRLEWTWARQVKMTHRLEGQRRARLGMLWMDGARGGATQRAVLPWADRMAWMQIPSEGVRLALGHMERP